jgi:hypothetical protein
VGRDIKHKVEEGGSKKKAVSTTEDKTPWSIESEFLPTPFILLFNKEWMARQGLD